MDRLTNIIVTSTDNSTSVFHTALPRPLCHIPCCHVRSTKAPRHPLLPRHLPRPPLCLRPYSPTRPQMDQIPPRRLRRPRRADRRGNRKHPNRRKKTLHPCIGSTPHRRRRLAQLPRPPL